MTTKHMMIEELLERADRAASAGRHVSAIARLYEVLKLDPSRRDVARMVRDLQFEVLRRKERWRRTRRVVAPLLLGGLLGAALELRVQYAYEAIPPAAGGDAHSIEQRLAGLDGLIEGHPLWFGGVQARRERADLREEVERMKALEAAPAGPELNPALLSDSARFLAGQLVERGDYEGAVEQYQMALESAPPDWEHREQVQTDLEAVRAFLEDRGEAVP